MPDAHFRVETPAPKTGPTVVVEDGTIVDGANSYIDVAYADLYHSATVYNQEWVNATPDQKSASVINATRAIDANTNFNGYIIDSIMPQPLKWPRIYCPNPEVYLGYPYGGYPISMGNIGYGYYAVNVIPKTLMDATALQALEILRVDRLADNPAQGIASMRVDVIDLTFKPGVGSMAGGAYLPLSHQVAALLAPLGVVTTGSSFSAIPVARVQ